MPSSQHSPDAAVLRDAHEMAIARDRGLAVLGAAATIRALAVAVNFEMMNRLLDATGVGPTSTSLEIGVPLPSRFRRRAAVDPENDDDPGDVPGSSWSG